MFVFVNDVRDVCTENGAEHVLLFLAGGCVEQMARGRSTGKDKTGLYLRATCVRVRRSKLYTVFWKPITP